MEVEMLKNKKLFISDMDGTFYLGSKLLTGSLDFATKVREIGGKLVFLTNNSSRTPEEYIRKLLNMGIDRSLFEVYTSGEATIRFIKEHCSGASVYLIATPSVENLFIESGIRLVNERPDAVVLTYDTTLDYAKIRNAALFLRAGAKYIASHPDFNCPTELGPIPDVGSLIKLFEASTGRVPDHIIGKPDPSILEMLLKDYGFYPDECVIIGDRLYTDIECGLRANVDAILVLSGETTPEMVPENHEFLVIDNVGVLAGMITEEFAV